MTYDLNFLFHVCLRFILDTETVVHYVRVYDGMLALFKLCVQIISIMIIRPCRTADGNH